MPVSEYIVTRFHHGGLFKKDSCQKYVGEKDVYGFIIDKDHFSLTELCSYTKDLGYEVVEAFFHFDASTQEFVYIRSDMQLLNLVKDLGHGDIFDVYVQHVVSDPIVVEGGPVGLLPGPDDNGLADNGPADNGPSDNGPAVSGPAVSGPDDCGPADNGPADSGPADNGPAESVEVSGNCPEMSRATSPTNINSQTAANLEEDRVEGRGDLVGSDSSIDWTDSDYESSESELDNIPDEDGSDVDEELRFFRDERRKKKADKKAAKKAVDEDGKTSKEKAVGAEEVCLGQAGIDRGFEDIGKDKAAKYAGKLGGDEEYIDSSDVGSEDSADELDVDAQKGVDLPRRKKSNKLRYDTDAQYAIFEVGMVFDDAVSFRKAVADYAIQNKVHVKLRPNDKTRVRVKCIGIQCKWLLFASIDRDSGDFMVKNYFPVHNCDTFNKNKLCNANYIADKLKDTITSHPSMSILEVQKAVRSQLGMYVGRSVCYRAKMKVLKKCMGDWTEEFARLCDYAEQIKCTNPGSSCFVKTDRECQPGKNLFVYFYVCFDALKKGWMQGCRKIIGFDGCFLKGACKGELLVAVGRNGNQQMYPIAWAVVGTETKDSWGWFIQHLITDLELGTGEGLTVMSDMQKGLQSSIRQLLPDCEQRMCARHIWANWSKNWRGEARRKQFWKCSKASFEVLLQKEFTELGKLGKKEICESLLSYNKEFWCRSLFKEHARCDIVENNMCETFNSWILDARHKSIISMLEDIRRKIMKRHVDMRKFAAAKVEDITPMAKKVLDDNIDAARDCEILWNGDTGCEVEDGKYIHTIDLKKKTCTCRLWQLRGIPCTHAVCAFFHLDKDPKDEVEHWYRRDTFLKAYQFVIQPISNMHMWPPTTNMVIEPPAPRIMPGRPKRNRRKSKDEPKKKWGKKSKKGVKMTCSKCQQVGHNRTMCLSEGGMGESSRQGSNNIPTQASQQESSAVPSSSTGTAAATGRGRGTRTVAGRGRRPFIPPGRGGGTASTRKGRAFGGVSDGTAATDGTAAANSKKARDFVAASELAAESSSQKRVGTAAAKSKKTKNVAATSEPAAETSSVRLGTATGKKRCRGSGDVAETVSKTTSVTTANKRPKQKGYGLYIDPKTSRTVLNPGTASEKVVIRGKVLQSAAGTNLDLGFQPTGLKWKDKKAVSTAQLQQMRDSKAQALRKKTG